MGEHKIEKQSVEQRETSDKLQTALRKREEDLSMTRNKIIEIEEKERITQQTMSLTISENVTKAVIECEERLGGEIAILNRKLTHEDTRQKDYLLQIQELNSKLKDVGTNVRMETEIEMKELNDTLETKEKEFKENASKHISQKKKLVARVGGVEKAFTSFKQKAREQITSLTDNVAEQQKQLSSRIEECERLRIELNETNEKYSNDTSVIEEKHKEAMEILTMDLISKQDTVVSELRGSLSETSTALEWTKKENNEMLNELSELRTITTEQTELIRRSKDEGERNIQECATQILAFNERNENVTMELQDLVAERAALKLEVKKKNLIVEDAVSTITELRNELQSAEEDAEETISDCVRKLEEERETNVTLGSRNKLLMEESAKSKAIHTAQLGSIERTMNQYENDIENEKRKNDNLENDKVTLI